MNKKLLLIYLLIFIFSSFFYNYYMQTTFTFYNYDNEYLTTNLINNYLYGAYEKKINSESKILQIVLNDIDYKEWLNVTKYIDLKVSIVDPNSNSAKLVITLNLRKDYGVIIIYNKINNTYYYENKIENLVNIKEINVITEQKLNRDFLLVYEFLEENMGAYFEDNFLRIFTLVNNQYIEVFRESIDYEITLYNKWINPSSSDTKWYKFTQNGTIKYTRNSSNIPAISYSTILRSYESDNTIDKRIPDDFKLKESINVELNYTWNEKYNYFILGLLKTKETSELAGIIENSQLSISRFIQPNNKYFKIINNSGKIEYVNQKYVQFIED